MKLIDKQITKKELKEMAKKGFGDLVKAVVDVEKKILIIDASLHADEEAFLLSKGSKQQNLWGINFYPDLSGEDFIEFDSVINLRPNQGNNSRSVDDPKLQTKILDIVQKFVK